MNGEQLYSMYWQATVNEGFEVGTWSTLGDIDRNVWDEVAAAVERGEQEIDPVGEEADR